MTAGMMRHDAWRALNVIYRQQVRKHPTTLPALIGCNVGSDELVWLQHAQLLFVRTLPNLEPVDLELVLAGAVARPPADRIEIRISWAAAQWRASDPYQRSLQAAAASPHLPLWSMLHRRRVQLDAVEGLLDAGLVTVVDKSTGIEVPRPTRGRLSGPPPPWRLPVTPAGLRILALEEGDTTP